MHWEFYVLDVHQLSDTYTNIRYINSFIDQPALVWLCVMFNDVLQTSYSLVNVHVNVYKLIIDYLGGLVFCIAKLMILHKFAIYSVLFNLIMPGGTINCCTYLFLHAIDCFDVQLSVITSFHCQAQTYFETFCNAAELSLSHGCEYIMYRYVYFFLGYDSILS